MILLIVFLVLIEIVYTQDTTKKTYLFPSVHILIGEAPTTQPPTTFSFYVFHKFGEIKGAFDNMFGIYEIKDVSIGFDFGILNNLSIGFNFSKGYSSPNKRISLYSKCMILKQTSQFPFAITLYTSSLATYDKQDTSSISINNFTSPLRRISYFSEIMFSRMQGNFFFLLSASLVHRNFVYYYDINTNYAIRLSFAYKFSTLIHGILENSFLIPRDTLRYPIIGVGALVNTGGHKFGVMLTNSPNCAYQYLFSSNPYRFSNLRFAFFIRRTFCLKCL